jgi:predicted transcriptional regulator
MTRLDDERRRALGILAENPDGSSWAIMLARGFPLSLLNRLVRAGLVASHIEREERGDKAIEIVRVKITDAGRPELG